MYVPSSVAKPALSVTVLMNVPWNVVKSVWRGVAQIVSISRKRDRDAT